MTVGAPPHPTPPGAPRSQGGPWNPFTGFARILNDAGLSAPVRTPRGQDIMAACGQLKSASQRPRKGAREAAADA